MSDPVPLPDVSSRSDWICVTSVKMTGVPPAVVTLLADMLAIVEKICWLSDENGWPRVTVPKATVGTLLRPRLCSVGGNTDCARAVAPLLAVKDAALPLGERPSISWMGDNST